MMGAVAKFFVKLGTTAALATTAGFFMRTGQIGGQVIDEKRIERKNNKARDYRERVRLEAQREAQLQAMRQKADQAQV